MKVSLATALIFNLIARVAEQESMELSDFSSFTEILFVNL
jgi:hypothetical protein